MTTVKPQRATAALLGQLLPTDELRRWLGSLVGRFEQLLYDNIADVSILRDTRMADQELVAADDDQGVLFLGFGGRCGLYVDAACMDADGMRQSWIPPSLVLSPGELCGEYEAGFGGGAPQPFGWTIRSIDRQAGLWRFGPTVTEKLQDDNDFCRATFRQYLAWSNDALHLGYLSRRQREVASVADWLVRAAIAEYGDDAATPLEIVQPQTTIARDIGFTRGKINEVLKLLKDNDLIEFRGDRLVGTKYRIRSLRALRQMRVSGCDPRHTQMPPADGIYKRRQDAKVES